MYYALIQADQCVVGLGETAESARANAAEFLDHEFDEETGETRTPRQIADASPLISASSDAMREASMHSRLVVVECSDALAAQVMATGGNLAFSPQGRRIALESET